MIELPAHNHLIHLISHLHPLKVHPLQFQRFHILARQYPSIRSDSRLIIFAQLLLLVFEAHEGLLHFFGELVDEAEACAALVFNVEFDLIPCGLGCT